MKFFTKDQSGAWYLMQWKDGYVQFYEDYSNVINRKNYNWVDFSFIEANVEVERELGGMVTIELAILGLHLRIHHCFEVSAKWQKIVKDAEKAIKSGKCKTLKEMGL